MGYEVFSFVLGGFVVGLLWDRYKLIKQLERAQAMAALMFAEKMGVKIGGKEVKVEFVSPEELEELKRKGEA